MGIASLRLSNSEDPFPGTWQFLILAMVCLIASEEVCNVVHWTTVNCFIESECLLEAFVGASLSFLRILVCAVSAVCPQCWWSCRPPCVGLHANHHWNSHVCKWHTLFRGSHFLSECEVWHFRIYLFFLLVNSCDNAVRHCSNVLSVFLFFCFLLLSPFVLVSSCTFWEHTHCALCTWLNQCVSKSLGWQLCPNCQCQFSDVAF